MEFDEMKKIWDTQNEEPLYAFNEEALHRNIKSKKERAARKNNFTDFGLTAIFIITAIIYSFLTITTNTPDIYDYLIIATLLINIGYVWVGRVRRKKKEQTFDRTILDDLDHAISSVNYLANRSKSMLWSFILPAAILAFLGMLQVDASFWKWTGIASAFILSVILMRWDYNRCQKPKKQKLEALREKLTEDVEPN